MWYITFHGVDKSYNICAYDDSGNLVTANVLNSASGRKHLLKDAELRGIGFAPDGDFYVVNSQKEASQILQFSGTENSDHSRNYKRIFTSNATVDAIDHPFAYTVDPGTGNVFISSQDTNLVTQVYGPFGNGTSGSPAPIASALQKINLLDGTFVASAYTNLPAYSHLSKQEITAVPEPQGLDASPHDGSKVQNSVRGILYNGGRLYVADEPGNALKMYDGASGAYQGDFTMSGPIHLLGVGTKIYVSCGGDQKASPPVSPSVVCYDSGSATVTTVVNDSALTSVSGIAFGADGNFYVADRKAKTVRKYAPTTTPFTPLGIFIGSSELPDEPEFLLYVGYGIAG
jgi:hypothetical protein